MRIPQIPDSAPFSSSQRAWLNGFFAAVLTSREPSAAEDGLATLATAALGSAAPAVAVAEPEEEFPWRDASLPLVERLDSSQGRPLELRLMSAMAQLDTITQQNAALVEENAASAMQLNGQAQTMTETVQVFRIDASAPAQVRDAVALRKEMKGQGGSSSSRALAAV